MNTPVRVVSSTTTPVIRAGLQQLLAGTDDIVVAGTAANGAEALEVVRELKPDVVLMDLQMPGVDGVAATRNIRAEHLGVDVLVLTLFSDSERIVAAPMPAQSATCSRTPIPGTSSRASGRSAAASRRSTPAPPAPCSASGRAAAGAAHRPGARGPDPGA